MNGPASDDPTVDARIARMVELLADRDQQLADRLVVTELAARLERAEDALSGALERAVAAEEKALAASAETARLRTELAMATARLAQPDGRHPVMTGAERIARGVARRLPRR